MYCFWLAGLQFILLTNIHGHSVPLPPSVKIEEERRAAVCWNNSASIDKYPFHATVVFACEKEFPQFGVIISADYILATTYSLISEEQPCPPTVYVGFDDQGNGGSEHEAELTQIGDYGELSLFKLKNPIKFGPRAQPIKMVEVGKGPKLNDTVTLMALQQQSPTSTKRKVYAINETVINAVECEALMSGSHPDSLWQCERCLWAYSRRDLLCSIWRNGLMTMHDELIAIEKSGNSFTVGSERILEGYFSIEYYRALIKKHTGI